MTTGVFLGHFTNSETGFLMEPQAHCFGKLASQHALEICQSLLPDAGIIGTRNHAQLFIWVLNIQTQVSHTCKTSVLPTEPSPQPLTHLCKQKSI